MTAEPNYLARDLSPKPVFSPAQEARALISSIERMAGELENLRLGYGLGAGERLRLMRLRKQLGEMAKAGAK